MSSETMDSELTFELSSDPLEPLFIFRHTGEIILLGRDIREMSDKEVVEALREIGERLHSH
jgi:hypothetical protein